MGLSAVSLGYVKREFARVAVHVDVQGVLEQLLQPFGNEMDGVVVLAM